MRIACVQMDIVWEDKARNFARVARMLERATLPAETLLLLPEMFATGFSMAVGKIAESVEDGQTRRFLGEMARRHRCLVMGGMVTRAKGDKLGRNCALVVLPDGSLLANYAKLHPFTFGKEAKHYAGGSEVLAFTWREMVVAPAICYDLRFPELFRTAVRKGAGGGAGAQVLAVIANWPAAREEHWVTLLRARAIENQCYVAACNRVGKDPSNSYSGRSLIIGPRGEILADAGRRARVISAEIRLPELVKYRKAFPALRDMREGFFGGA